MSEPTYATDLMGNQVATWKAVEDGVTYAHQMVQIESTVLYGTSVDGRPWVNTTVRNPDRFGWLSTGLPPRKARSQFKQWVTNFIAGTEVDGPLEAQ